MDLKLSHMDSLEIGEMDKRETNHSAEGLIACKIDFSMSSLPAW